MRTRIARARGFLRELADDIPPPEEITAIQVVIYLVAAAGGVSALAHPPGSITGQWGVVLTTLWALFQGVGGAVAAPAAIQGWWMIEKPALLAVATGITMYATGVVTAHFAEPGNRLPQLSVILIAIFYLATRFIRIHKYAYQPGK